MSAENLPAQSIVIRRATVGDAESLYHFAARVFLETFAATATAADMEAYLIEAYSPEIQAREIADSGATLFLAEDRDTLVGYAHLIEDHEPTSIELKRIYVDASWQGRGLAKRLLEEVIRECRARGALRLWLSVWHRNGRAVGFYRKYGFRISGEMQFEWGDGVEGGFVMEIDPDVLVVLN